MMVGPEHARAQITTSLAFADAGTLPASILLYAESAVATGAAPTTSALAEITLAKPCGTITGGVLTLHMANPDGAPVLQQGIPRAARWMSGDGKLVAAGTVTDMANAGDFRVSGGTTAPGDDSPMLYAGGLVLLGDVVFD